MNAQNIVRRDEPAAVVVSESGAVLQMIERVAKDTTVDLDRFERLLAVQERIMARQAKASFDAAFAAMQPDIPVITEKGEIKHGDKVLSRYAKWEDISETLRPVLAQHRFSLRSKVTQAENKVTVTTYLSYGDHTEETAITLPIDTSGAKNAVQAIGSSISYAQRYGAKALLSMSSRSGPDRDDDGKSAEGAATIDEEQIGELVAMIESVGANKEKFLKYFRVETLADLPVKDYQRALDALKAKSRS